MTVAATGMFEIETKNLAKKFGRLPAVNDLNLQVTKGTIFGFLGVQRFWIRQRGGIKPLRAAAPEW